MEDAQVAQAIERRLGPRGGLGQALGAPDGRKLTQNEPLSSLQIFRAHADARDSHGQVRQLLLRALGDLVVAVRAGALVREAVVHDVRARRTHGVLLRG